jgi:hypothetical protein
MEGNRLGSTELAMLIRIVNLSNAYGAMVGAK